jgi:hypothetical protein
VAAASVCSWQEPARPANGGELEKDGRIIREERQGVRLLVDLTKGDLASAIAAVENPFEGLTGIS